MAAAEAAAVSAPTNQPAISEPRRRRRAARSQPAPVPAMATWTTTFRSERRAKGTLPHRSIGWIWVLLMASVAISSLWIHQIRLFGPWSPIHLLSIFTLTMLPFGVWMAHRHRVIDHRRIMISIFTDALVIAGLFTLPGWIMHAVVFGP